MSENQQNFIPVQNVPTTAQTAAEQAECAQAVTAGTVYTQATTVPQYQQPIIDPAQANYQQQPVIPVQNGYPPVYYASAPSAQEKRKLSGPARVLIWICGIVAALTLIVGCATICILCMRAITKPSSTVVTDGSGSSQGGGSNDGGYGGFGFSDDFGSGNGGSSGFDFLPIPGDWGTGGSSDGGSTTQSFGAGLGIKVTQLQLEFVIEDKYDSGLVIVSMEDECSFNGTEVQENDMIVAMDGEATPTIDGFKSRLAKMKPGDSITLTIARYENGVASTFEQEVTLIEIGE